MEYRRYIWMYDGDYDHHVLDWNKGNQIVVASDWQTLLNKAMRDDTIHIPDGTYGQLNTGLTYTAAMAGAMQHESSGLFQLSRSAVQVLSPTAYAMQERNRRRKWLGLMQGGAGMLGK